MAGSLVAAGASRCRSPELLVGRYRAFAVALIRGRLAALISLPDLAARPKSSR
jgi:hypothetical protein